MPTPVFLTIDTEFAWRHHAAGVDPEQLYRRSIEPAGVGLGYQLDLLARHGLNACFFVDPMPALLYGTAPFERMVGAILAAGQEVQLHLHPRWAKADAVDRTASDPRRELRDYDVAGQRALIAEATALLIAAGAPTPVAFRAGTYGANDDTLAVLASSGSATTAATTARRRRRAISTCPRIASPRSGGTASSRCPSPSSAMDPTGSVRSSCARCPRARWMPRFAMRSRGITPR